MAHFTFRTWGASTHTVQADVVEFTPTHVVFRNSDGWIVFADTANNVLHLKQIAAVKDE